ncbi:DUF6233 domain-containing protein [Streptomyces sp. NPDC057543]|uniref:DUF6233 domain-containing protein n=1 Tax=Streptomyces sp. NPDC057543 TaxID=3346163 RepID=UPI0036B47BDE
MSEESVSRLQKLRFLRRVQQRQLAQTDRWIEQEERRQAALAERQPPPPLPDWVVEQGIGEGRRAIGVHQGFCRPSGTRVKAISRDQAVSLLAEDSALACQLCRPDTALGLL